MARNGTVRQAGKTRIAARLSPTNATHATSTQAARPSRRTWLRHVGVVSPWATAGGPGITARPARPPPAAGAAEGCWVDTAPPNQARQAAPPSLAAPTQVLVGV